MELVVDNTKQKKRSLAEEFPFFSINSNKCHISPFALTEWLEKRGYAQILVSKKPRCEVLIQITNSIIRNVTSKQVKQSIVNQLREYDVEGEQSNRRTYLDAMIKFPTKTLSQYMENLVVYAEEASSNERKLRIFRDTKTSCHIPFLNGVVCVTANKTNLIPYNNKSNKSLGCIYESSIINRKIEIPNELKIDDEILVKDQVEGLFSDFVNYAFKLDVEPHEQSNDRHEGTENDRYITAVQEFERCYGYLIHRYNDPANARAIVLIDARSQQGSSAGGTGKSLLTTSVGYLRNLSTVDGRRFAGPGSDASRFNFSTVTNSTEVVLINDLKDNFDLGSIFNVITDDMEVEGKGSARNKFVIPFDRKPKLALTTNHYIAGQGSSFERRQVTIRIGDFFSRCVSKNINTNKVIGKTLFKDFTDSEWNDFYLYSIRCVQQFLRHGIGNTRDVHGERRALIESVEGKSGNGCVIDFFHDVFSAADDEVEISVGELWKTFQQNVPVNIREKICDNKNTLKQMLWSYCEATDFTFNPHKKGCSMSERRWLHGPRDSQEEWVKICAND